MTDHDVAPSPKMRPPFDPALLDSLRGCDEALAAIAMEMGRIHHSGLHVEMAARMRYLRLIKAEIKNTKRQLAARRDLDEKGIYCRHLKAVLGERFGEAALEMLTEAGDRTRKELLAMEDARRVKVVGSALPPMGSVASPRRRATEVA